MIFQDERHSMVKMNLNHTGKGWDWLTAGLLSEGNALGVYWDGTGLVLAQVQRSLTGFVVPHLHHLLPPEGNLEELAPSLAEIAAAWKLEGAPASLAVSQDLGFVQPATLPRAAAENLAQVVSYELDRFLPLPADRLFVDFQVVEQTEAEIRLILLALRREPVEACLRLLTQAGLRLTSLTLAPVATANAFAVLGEKMPPDWLLLHAGKENFELSQIKGGGLQPCRTGRVGKSGELVQESNSVLENLRRDGKGPEVLGLYGAGASRDLRRALSQQVMVPLVTPELLKVTGLPPDFSSEEALPAVGAGLLSLKKAALKGNLLPVSERAPSSLGSFTLSRWLLTSLAALLGLWLLSLLISPRVELYQVNRQIAQLAPEAQKIQRQLEEGQALEKQTAIFRRLEQSPSTLQILKQLTELIPKHTWLSQLQISQQALEINGVSKTAADLIPILEKSGWLTKTEFVSPIVTDANKLEHFKIKAEIKGLEPGT
jgi:Tfp pilus assembly protein PilN